ncbi:MAG: SHOCT domain-containing protein [Halothiobacillaceae bacterium]|jgi:hypothetical protein|nr:SHOCT domain-containing protein [Halothiobacillaceae bacterium]
MTSPSLKTLVALGFGSLLTASLLTGCGGGGATLESRSSMTTTTIGKELVDLDEAYKRGLMSESEYNKARKRILERGEN